MLTARPSRPRLRALGPRALGLRALAALAAALLAVASCGSGDDDVASNDTNLEAIDVADDVGLAQTSKTHGKNCMADINDDGFTDILVSHHEDPWTLFLGQADNTFVADGKFTLEHLDRHACAVADFNADGLLDIYIATGGCRGTCQNAKELWIQQADHTFVDEAEAWGIADPQGRGRTAITFDANGDGLPDLFTGQAEGVDFPSLSRLWINRGDHFALQEDEAVTNELGNICVDAADIDGDGLDEIAFCSRKDGFFLLRNDDGRFVDATDDFGADRTGRRKAAFADLNGDDRPDLVMLGKSRLHVFLNDDGRFGDASYSSDTESGADMAFGDIDGDGDLDIYVQERGDSDAPDQVLVNEGDGRTFSLGPELPSPSDGGGESVVAIDDWNGTGRAAFVVSNGYQETEGPLQVIEFIVPD